MGQEVGSAELMSARVSSDAHPTPSVHQANTSVALSCARFQRTRDTGQSLLLANHPPPVPSFRQELPAFARSRRRFWRMDQVREPHSS